MHEFKMNLKGIRFKVKMFVDNKKMIKYIKSIKNVKSYGKKSTKYISACYFHHFDFKNSELVFNENILTEGTIAHELSHLVISNAKVFGINLKKINQRRENEKFAKLIGVVTEKFYEGLRTI